MLRYNGNYDCGGKALPFTYPRMRDLEHFEFSDVVSSYWWGFLGEFDC